MKQLRVYTTLALGYAWTYMHAHNRSRCHGNVRLNDDSKSRISMARDSKSRRRMWRAECA